VAQIYFRALGSLFVASYDSQNYGGGVLTLLHTGLAGLPASQDLKNTVYVTIL
jgi:hypothetical protein